MNNDLTLKFVLGLFKETIVDRENIPSNKSFTDKFWNEYGFQFLDEFVNRILDECSPTEEPNDSLSGESFDQTLIEKYQPHWIKQTELLGQIVNQIDESSIEASGLDKEYLQLAKDIAQYAYDRINSVASPSTI